MGLIVGDLRDPHVSAVVAATQAAPEVLDAASFVKRPLTITREGLKENGRPITATRGWIRRLAPSSWTDSLDTSTLVGAERAASLSALAALLHDERIDWLTPIQRLGAAENKLFQYRHAERVHVPVPEWLVTTDPDQAPQHDGWVTKPLGPAGFVDSEGVKRTVPTTLFDPASRSAVASAPFIIQRLVPAERHARVVTVGGFAFSSILPAGDLPIDWRISQNAHRSFTTIAAPDSVHALACAVANQLGVGYSAQDWIQDTDGAWWFIDLNPAGQWLFLPEPVAALITDAIASYMDGRA